MSANLINTDQIAILLDNDGDRVETWDHMPSEEVIGDTIRNYRYPNHAPFTLFLAARKEVWEYEPDDDYVYKIFEQTNKAILSQHKFGKRRVVVR